MAQARRWSPPQDEFDEYKLVRRLGSGAMGDVYLAQDRLLDRLVAVKFIAADLESEPGVRERFFVEARAAARLQHPNVVAVYRVGELEHRPYLISEFVKGERLDQIARPMPWTRALELGIGLARGLAAAHRRGVLHRDIKPANTILAENGDVKLLDFGLAKLIDAAATDGLTASGTPVPMPPAPPTPPALDDTLTPTPQPAAIAEVPFDMDATRATPAPDNRTPGAMSDPGLTRAGAVMGTPYYMAPEVWRGESATRRSDVYSLGALMFELCAGQPPNRHVQFLQLGLHVQDHDSPLLLSKAPTVDPRLAAVVDRCLRRNPDERYASAEELRDAFEEIAPSKRTAAIPEGNPYRGLLAFEQEHRALFFGRGAAIRSVLDRMRSEPFLLVAGDSGVGKSSLCRAGVLPSISDGALGGERAWQVRSLMPGRHPIAAIAAVLAPVLGRDESAIAEVMGRDPASLARELRHSHAEGKGLCLFIDQLEELVTLADPTEANAAAELIARLAIASAGVRVLATVRGDYLTRLAQIPVLGDEVARALYLLGPLSPEGIREAIVGPAETKGVKFESAAMVDALVDEAAETHLPLLQFVLAELWDARDPASEVISAASLEKLGGVAGALAREADGVLERLLPGPRAAARKILLALVTSDGTRKRQTEAELIGDDRDARTALDALVRGRLLMAREDADGTAYEVAHEALIQDWATLRGWLHDDADRRVVEERLTRATTEWERLGRPRDGLWNARQLAEAEKLDEPSPKAQEFLRASRGAIVRRRVVRWVLVAGVVVSLVAVYAIVQLNERRDRARRVGKELTTARAALEDARDLAAKLEAQRAAAFAKFDAYATEEAEALWTEVRALEGEVDDAYGDASRAAETALMIDASRSDARALLADTIYERALVAEAQHQAGVVAELRARLDLYDAGGERAKRWAAPGRVQLASDPAGAAIAVERWEERRWVPAGAGVAPFDRELDPGSYRFTLTKDGRPPVRYPVLLARGEAIEDTIAIPATVPDGFAYVPPARVLVGSTYEDGHRRDFQHAPPLHAIRAGGFFVAKRETTYDDWIRWLDGLPDDEREKRSPRAATFGAQGYVALEKIDGRWRLTLQPSAAVRLEAWDGEAIIYPGRVNNASVDWRQLPVTGISSEDAMLYAAWVHPLVRLCDEEEWEVAARGADGRTYAIGETVEPAEGNWQLTYSELARGPDAVGEPDPRAVYDLDGLLGNVFDMVSSRQTPGLTASGRGGAFGFDLGSMRVEQRSPVEGAYRDIAVGLRLCRSMR